MIGLEYYIGSWIQGVKLSSKNELVSARIIFDGMQALLENDTMVNLYSSYRNALEKYVQKRNMESDLQIYVLSGNILNEELMKVIAEIIPFVGLTCLIILAFTVLSNFSCDESKPHMILTALAGVLSTILAMVSAFGVCFYFGIKFNSMVAISPFLLIAIGVDDAFILIGAWKKSTNAGAAETEERLGETLKEAGPGILLTSVTDAASFGIGVISGTQAVSVFCIFTAIGICFDFLFQLTFFPAVLALCGKREEKREKSGKMSKFCNLHLPLCNFQEKCVFVLVKPWFKGTVMILYLAYLIVSVYGCTQVNIDLKTIKLILDDSSRYPFFLLLETEIWEEKIEAEIYIPKRDCSTLCNRLGIITHTGP